VITEHNSRAEQEFGKTLGMELQHTASYTPRQNPTPRRRTAEHLESPAPGDLAGRKQQRVGHHGI